MPRVCAGPESGPEAIASDLTDQPSGRSSSRTCHAYVLRGQRGRPRVWPLRAIVEAILYLDRAGCRPGGTYRTASRAGPRCTGTSRPGSDDGTLARLHDALRAQVRAAAGRDPQPTAAVIDSQSVRAADTVPKSTRGWDNAKKVNGRKRHIAVASMGLLLAVVITAASVQDRDAARPLLWNQHRTSGRIRLIWAAAVYTGKLAAWAAALKMTLQIVPRRNPHAFEVLPRRWVVERTFALDQQAPPHRPRLRAPAGQPRSHDLVGHDRPHGGPSGPAQPLIKHSLRRARHSVRSDRDVGGRALRAGARAGTGFQLKEIGRDGEPND